MVVALELVSLVFLGGAGCSDNQGSHQAGNSSSAVSGSPAVSSSQYSVSYNIGMTVNRYGDKFSGLNVDIKGPAAKLAVILTYPDNDSRIEVIEKDEMMANSKTIGFHVDNTGNGTYVLMVKTVEPEKVIWRKEISLNSGELTATDLNFGFFKKEQESFEARMVVCMNVQQTGNLPIRYCNAKASIDGVECIAWNRVDTLLGQQGWLTATAISGCFTTLESNLKTHTQALYGPTRYLENGKEYNVKLTLFYGDDSRKTVSFEKKCICHDWSKP